MAKRRQFGKIRKLPSGRYQASFVDPTGVRQTAPNTFTRSSDASRWLAQVETDISRGTWRADAAGSIPFGEYGLAVLRDNPNVGPRWRETCERNMRLHLAPLHRLPLKEITPRVVREWHAAALRGSGGRTSIAQSYRFLRTVMNTAVREDLIIRNPCQVTGAGTVRAAERPIATPAQIVGLVEAIAPRYRAAVLMAAWCGLRRGEIAGLLTEDIDIKRTTVTIRRNRVELMSPSAKAYDGAPKTEAGKRTITIPPHVMPFVEIHMAEYAGNDRFFVSRRGGPLRGNALYLAFKRARSKVGLDHLTFHDLRHTGQTLAAQAGATLADLMKRLGHSSMVAAKRYLHAVDGRDAEIANALSELAAHGNAAKLPRSITMRS